MRFLKNLLLSLKLRGTKKTRLALGAYIKGAGNIRFGMGCKIHDSVSIDASRSGLVTLGDSVTINRLAMLTGGRGGIISYQHLFDGHQPIREQASEAKPIHVARDVWIGANAVILAGVQIGEGAVIGAGAVVSKDIPAWSIAVGVPARVVRQREMKPSNE